MFLGGDEKKMGQKPAFADYDPLKSEPRFVFSISPGDY